MDAEPILTQLTSFASSLCDILSVLAPLILTPSQALDHQTRDTLQTTKKELLDTILLLNSILIDTDMLETLAPGSLVLAPRFLHGQLHYDFAVILHISKKIEENHSISAFSEENHQLLRVFAKDLNDCNVQLLWLRPQSKYELITSKGVSFDGGQVNLSFKSRWQQETKAVCALKEGDSVLYVHTIPSIFYGMWCEGQVVRLFDEEKKVQIVSKTTSEEQYFLKDWDVKEVIALKSNSFKETPSPRSSLSSSSRPKAVEEDDDAGDEEDEGVIDLPSYSSEFLHKNNSFKENDISLRDFEYNIGAWERHTKGIGSKLLRKMGYQRQKQTGLGKFAQGMVKPIDSLMKPLPAGLSLDYLHETRSNSNGEKDYRHLKRKIVSDFNGKSVKKMPESRCLFEFLNNLPANNPQRHESLTSGSLKKSVVNGNSGKSSFNKPIHKLF